jgi:hypothetical protein
MAAADQPRWRPAAGLLLLLVACASELHVVSHEVCDGADNNLDGQIDEGFDRDGDGYTSCGSGARAADCDDEARLIGPHMEEECNGRDDDCDGLLPARELDQDSDGRAPCAGDCDDGDPLRSDLDLDGDRWPACAGDPDDQDPLRFPGADELCNGLDDDADGRIPADELDGDGDGLPACAGDCDDEDAGRLPGDADGDGADGCGVLRDCDDQDPSLGAEHLRYIDDDGDGIGADPIVTCPCVESEDTTCPVTTVIVGGDCDDADPATSPAAAELCNDTDDDCDGLVDEQLVFLARYRDVDGDGAGSDEFILSCAPPLGYAEVGGDCAPADPTRGPLADERCNGVDDDCDGLVDEPSAVDAPGWFPDADRDGGGEAGCPLRACIAPPDHVPSCNDCDDDNPLVLHIDSADCVEDLRICTTTPPECY